MITFQPPWHEGTGPEKITIQLLNSGVGTDAKEYTAEMVGADAKPFGAWKCHDEEKFVACVRPSKADPKILSIAS